MFFDFALYSILNLHAADWQSEFPSIRASNAFSVLALTILCGSLVFYIVSYFRLPRETRLAVYTKKFAPLFSDTNMEGELSEKWYLTLVPAFHFMKRLLFVSLVVVAPNFI